ncbi:COPI associated protein-domain-containing protein [Phascolomyces articulosus]|uniref:COPI associated protein-domain-containing protein n=1 Tax=Phascolomyces articulosus TaxID=60185 RepID=A0AAD5PC71_9FUNG|nr:COPI associated protein-domain-containing protein [Phascolomyces articulosus]
MRIISRTKIEDIIGFMFNGLNVLFCLLVIGAGIYKSIHSGFADIVICIYGGIIAALMIVNEIKSIEVSEKYFLFLTTYRGRSMIFIFFGCVVLDSSIVNIVAGTLNLCLGLLYMILSFITISSFPQPRPISGNQDIWNDYSADGMDLGRPKHHSVESEIAIRLKSPGPRLSSVPPPATPQHFAHTEEDATSASTTVGPFRGPY